MADCVLVFGTPPSKISMRGRGVLGMNFWNTEIFKILSNTLLANRLKIWGFLIRETARTVKYTIDK
jgi:hypothetical protein